MMSWIILLDKGSLFTVYCLLFTVDGHTDRSDVVYNSTELETDSSAWSCVNIRLRNQRDVS